jgi:hypothetical protein
MVKQAARNATTKKGALKKKKTVTKAKQKKEQDHHHASSSSSSSSPSIRSKFVGVYWNKKTKKWYAQITIDGKVKFLGSFEDEKEAACKYDEQAALNNKPVNFPQHEGQEQAVKPAPHRDRSKVPDVTRRSKFVGVTWNKSHKKWEAYIQINGKLKRLGYFDDEKEAACKYDEQAAVLNRPVNFPQHEGQEQAVKPAPMKDLSKVQDVTRRSKFVGVNWHKRSKKWKAEIRIDGKKKFLGYFNDEKEAACKYDEQAALLNKPVNFPQHEGQEQAVKEKQRKNRSKVRDMVHDDVDDEDDHSTIMLRELSSIAIAHEI